MPPPRTDAALAKRAPARAATTRLSDLRKTIQKRVGAWITDLEYRLRVSWPFTHGSGAPRVFYPGCSLTAADPELVMRAYAWLRERDPEVELWSDCCGMPLEKFGSPDAAARGRDRTRRMIHDSGTREIITACGNCTVQFDSLKIPGLRITSLYGLLAEADWAPPKSDQPVIVHHPCSARIDKAQQTHFRSLAGKLSLKVINVDETKHPLSCCLVKTPAAMAKREALAGSKLITYCAHCTMEFQGDVPTRHVLQEAFGAPEDRWLPRGKISRFRQYLRFARLAAARLVSGKARAAELPPAASREGS